MSIPPFAVLGRHVALTLQFSFRKTVPPRALPFNCFRKQLPFKLYAFAVHGASAVEPIIRLTGSIPGRFQPSSDCTANISN